MAYIPFSQTCPRYIYPQTGHLRGKASHPCSHRLSGKSDSTRMPLLFLSPNSPPYGSADEFVSPSSKVRGSPADLLFCNKPSDSTSFVRKGNGNQVQLPGLSLFISPPLMDRLRLGTLPFSPRKIKYVSARVARPSSCGELAQTAPADIQCRMILRSRFTGGLLTCARWFETQPVNVRSKNVAVVHWQPARKHRYFHEHRS